MKKRCLTGFIGITVLGMLLHNAYSWTRPFQLFALMAPVNESVWEHLKMGYWSVLLYALLEQLYHKKALNNIFPGIAVGSTILILTIVIVFYSYTAFTGRSILWIDIAMFGAGAFFCRWAMCSLGKSDKLNGALQSASRVYLVAIALLFALMTYFPPNRDIFIDHSQVHAETGENSVHVPGIHN